MLSKFKEHILTHNLHCDGDRILMAVSGGLDSVVMAYLYHAAGFKGAIAHCNFSLRGDESDRDQMFVEDLAARYHFSFHTKRFDTIAFALDNGISLQMAARTLRYQWFSELIEALDFSCVAVAHHADDVAETMLINLVRGTGIAGMHGIHGMRGHVVRPLLFATRRELETFAETKMLTWCEDSSNSETKYLRNRIRHQVLPLLREINPLVVDAFNRHARLMEGYEKLALDAIESVKAEARWKVEAGGSFSFTLKPVLKSPAPSIVLYHILSPFGISAAMSEAIAQMQTGHAVLTPGWRIVRDRESIAIIPLTVQDSGVMLWQNDGSSLQLSHGWINREPDLQMQQGTLAGMPGFGDPGWAFLDAAKLRYPLEVRRWRNGDTFRPLGMEGTKLVSDFVTDEKMDAVTKEHVTLLLSGGDVVWVIGHRIDDRFKITGTTSDVACIRFHREHPL